jgi:SP family sugar:H+ symporter-like MFS transporter
MKDWLCTFGEVAADGTCSITSGQESLVVSILSAGTFFGALAGAPIGDRLGRRWGIIIGVLVFFVGVILQLVATALPLFIVGRVFAGLGVGVISTLVPAYQSEWYVSRTIPLLPG